MKNRLGDAGVRDTLYYNECTLSLFLLTRLKYASLHDGTCNGNNCATKFFFLSEEGLQFLVIFGLSKRNKLLLYKQKSL